MNLNEFLLAAAAQGPCVGIQAEIPSTWAVPPDIEVRAIDGARVNSVDALFDAFAAAWHFPPWFGRNKDAFNDFIRDLDNMLNTATGKPPARGYLSVITDAHLFLVDQSEDFFWFASKMPVYRNYYRDEARPPAAFALILTAPADQLDAVRERWLTVGIDVATVTL